MIVVLEEALDILGGQKHKVARVRLELLRIDVALARDQIKQIVRLLASALLLYRVIFNQLGELAGALSHRSISTLLAVVLLGLALELTDDLVFLAELEVKLSKLILQDCAQFLVSRCFTTLLIYLRLFFLLRNKEVLLFNTLEFGHQRIIGLLYEVFAARKNLYCGLQLLNFFFLVLNCLHVLVHLEYLVAILRNE